MRIVESNRLEVLADDLLSHWPRAAEDDLAAVSIVVPSLGMGRWLTYRIASTFSVCAQVDFVYPATYVWSLFAAILPELADQSPFDAATLTWRIYRLFGKLRPAPDFEPLSAYLGSAEPRDRLALARRVAGLYAEVLAMRPEWAPNWQRGRLNKAEPAEHERWLAGLWRQLAKEISAAGEVHPRDLVLARLKQDPSRASALPARITIFGVPHMAPLYQSVFESLSKYTEVTAYLVNPSPEFWFDLESEARRARRIGSVQGAFDFEPDGQRLLSALGREAKENLSTWGVFDADRQGLATTVEELFVEPQGRHLLDRLKTEVYGALQTGQTSVLDANDRSVEVHICHSLSRQLEVLHDQLLAAFDAPVSDLKRLSPGDILVLLPDIDAAAPLIDAVFGAVPADRHIPFVVSGRLPDGASPLISAFVDIVSLPSGRFAVTELVDLLALPAIALSFGINEAMREQIAAWLKDTGVHWGLDAATKQRLGLPATGRHTFAEGIAELYLGYASAADRPALIDGILPYPDIEGKDAEALGRLSRFLSCIEALTERLARPRSPAAWSAEFNRLCEQFFLRRADPAHELSRLDAALSSIAKTASSVAFDEPVTLAVMLDALRHALSDGAPGAVPAGSVVFAGFGALRQLPYRFICMLDLNGDGSFPRNPNRPEFDLLRRPSRIGDRNLIEEDRGAFLDAILSTGERLYCSYNGRSIRDNAVLPPSSVLDDLIDSLADLTTGGRAALRAKVVIEHPLQPFSLRYFAKPEVAAAGPARIFSFASELLLKSRPDAGSPGFFEVPLEPPGEQWREVSLPSLVRALNDPITFLLEQRLGLDLREDYALLDEQEPDRIAPLERKSLREKLFLLYEAGVRDPALTDVAAAFPNVPEGVLGQIVLRPEIGLAAAFAEAVRAERPALLHHRRFVLERGAYRVYGGLEGLHRGGRFDATLTDFKSRDLLSLWVTHLVLQLMPPEIGAEPVGRASKLVGASQVASFEPTEQAGEELDNLLDLYWQALHQPVPLIPDISLAFVSQSAGANAKDALANARRQFAPSRGFARADQRAYRIAYGASLSQLPEGFSNAAMRVYGPLVKNLIKQPAAVALRLQDEDDLLKRAELEQAEDG